MTVGVAVESNFVKSGDVREGESPFKDYGSNAICMSNPGRGVKLRHAIEENVASRGQPLLFSYA